VSTRPCSIHGQRVNGKLATFYNRWVGAEGTWKRYKQWLCAHCATDLLAHLRAGLSETSPELFVCSVCGSPISEIGSSVYLTVYPPRSESREYALTICPSCSQPAVASLQDGAVELPNRPGFDVGASGPNTEEWKDF
jgi:hypothetical protein